ncbi:MAG TPA: DUF3866 family protein [Actinomycetota bacterium]|jgi:hypothetical protein
MPSFREGKVAGLTEERHDILRAVVTTSSGDVDAVGWPAMLGPVEVGDRVVLNTTGIELGLGTGGSAFILWDLDGPGPPAEFAGHVVKLRYTPWQTDVLAAEAPESPHHDALASATSIDGMPVVVCGLHSQVAGVAAGIRAAAPGARVGYLMTDAGALPIAWSDLLRTLRAKGLLDVTCTSGHAFGGDLEAVNAFSGMIALRHAANADVVIAALGPGIVGTNTALGFSGLEQGQLLDAATLLGGKSIACLRISFADERERHRGVSHHSITSLRLATALRCTVAVPALPEEEGERVHLQLSAAGIEARHDLTWADGRPGLDVLTGAGVEVSSMGRSIDETPELFLAAAAAGAVAAERL